MSLILTLAPTLEPVLLAEAKAHLRIPHASDDAMISQLIVAARRLVESRTGLRLIQQNWSMFLDRWPQAAVVDLPLFPVLSVNDILIYGEDNNAAAIEPAHYFLDVAARPPRLVFRLDRSLSNPGRRANGIEIRLTAGFGAIAASVPPELKQAILLLVADWFSNRGDVETASLPIAVLELLSPYRQLRLT